jgi:sporulation protein YlmC with PRC-barrel domain
MSSTGYRERTVRVDDLIRRPVWNRSGEYLGRIVDLVTDSDAGAPTVVAVLVDKTWHGRLLGYERPYAHGPWPIERVARMFYRDTRTIPWNEVCMDPPSPSPGTE